MTASWVAGFACSSESTTHDVDYTTVNAGVQFIGADGGQFRSPSGASVLIPPGALAKDTMITIAEVSSGGPTLPPGMTAASKIFAFEPHGQVFAYGVIVTLPRTVFYAVDVGMLRAEPGGPFASMPVSAVSGNLIQAETRTFSFFVAAIDADAY
jgi:hypothetical protein